MIKLDAILLILGLIVLTSEYTLQWSIIPEMSCGSHKYTSFVSLAAKEKNCYEYFCGGVLISGRFVITTTKCVKPQIKKPIYALFANNTIQIKVDAITKHSKNGKDRDITLLQLAIIVKSTDSVEPMCLPTMKNIGSILLNKAVESAEWTIKDNVMSIINTKKMAVTSRERCSECYNNVDDLLCGKKSERLLSVGGIIFKKMEWSDESEKYVLFGLITEQKRNCDDSDLIAIIDISSYLAWIKNNMDLKGVEGGGHK